MSKRFEPRRKTICRGVASLAALIILASAPSLAAQTLEIHVINVGWGASVLVRTVSLGPGSDPICGAVAAGEPCRSALLDAGNTGRGTNEVIPYLNSAAVNHTEGKGFDWAVAGHQHCDHIGGIDEVIGSGTLWDVRIKNYYNGSGYASTCVDQWNAAAGATTAGAPVAIPIGTILDLGYGVTMRAVATNRNIIGPHSGTCYANEENDNSIAFLISYCGFDMLWASDLGGGNEACTARSTAQNDVEGFVMDAIRGVSCSGTPCACDTDTSPGVLLSDGGLDVLFVSHHGSESSTHSKFMTMGKPSVAVLGTGRGQSAGWGLPRYDVVDNTLGGNGRGGVPQACADPAPAAEPLILQTEEGDSEAGTLNTSGGRSDAGYCVGNVKITTDTGANFTVTADGAVDYGPNELVASGLPLTFTKDDPGCVVCTTPTITSFTPDNGPSGTGVTITGTNFTDVTAVSFNGTAATFAVNSATQITATAPAGGTNGPITVSKGGTCSTTSSSNYYYPPTISSFSPTSACPDTSVTITGTNFTGATAVAFNGTPATFTIDSNTQITATVPAAATTGPISVTTPAGTASSSGSFTVLVGSASPPAGVTAAANGNAAILVSWINNGSASYNVYRSTTTGGPYTLLGSVAGVPYNDTTVAQNTTYYYVVRGLNCSESVNSNEAFATAACDTLPAFGGVSAAGPSGCGIALSWTAGSSSCGGTLSYIIYRSTDNFVANSTRIAQNVSGTSYTDTDGLTGGSTYYYRVHAFDSVSLKEEINTVTQSAVAPSGGGVSDLINESFNALAASALPTGWVVGSITGTTTDWRGAMSCGAPEACDPLSNKLRYGGTNCTNNYANNARDVYVETAAVTVSSTATAATISFIHDYMLNTGDGFQLQMSEDGGAFGIVPNSAFTSGAYDAGASISGCTAPCAWFSLTPTRVTCKSSTADLFAVCAGGNCAGKTLRFRFRVVTDGAAASDGWYIDDVVVQQTSPSCVASPNPGTSFTAKASSDAAIYTPPGFTKLEWMGAASSTVHIRYTTGTTAAPALPADGLPVGGGTGDFTSDATGYGTTTDGNLTLGEKRNYTLFVKSGSSYSAGKSVSATPQDATGNIKWTYSAGAASLNPPTINSAIYNLSNDRFAHSMNLAATGGDWPRTAPKNWQPLAMNAPSQSWAPVWNVSIGTASRVVVAASQDGRVYCVNADNGALIWTSPSLGDVMQATPSAYFAAWDSSGAPLAANMIFVTTRNSTGANKLHALNASDGTIRWTFDNGGGADSTKAIGAINGAVISYASLHRLWFASRKTAGGSQYTVWCLDYTDAGATVRWAADAGDIDGFPMRRGTTVYAGNNAGYVKAYNGDATITPNAELWSFATSDGPVKSMILPEWSTKKLYFSTTNRVWALDDTNGTQAGLANPWSTPASGAGSIPTPSRPVLVSGKLYVGSGSGSVVKLDTATNPPGQTVISLGAAAVGPPSCDFGNNWLHAGTESGLVYCILP